MKLFIVALKRLAERYEHALLQARRFSNFESEIIGIDGRELKLEDCVAPNSTASNFTAGQVGCAMSHVEIYRKMQSLRLDHALIVEDDAILPLNFGEVVEDCIPYLSPHGVISFYSPRPNPTYYSNRGAPVLPGGQLLAPTSKLDTHTTTAYLIGREAAAGIAAYNSPVRSLADHWFAFYDAGAVESVLLHHPMPVNVAHFDSSIGYGRGLSDKLKRLALNVPPVRNAVWRKRAREEERQKANIVVVDAPTFYESRGT